MGLQANEFIRSTANEFIRSTANEFMHSTANEFMHSTANASLLFERVLLLHGVKHNNCILYLCLLFSFQCQVILKDNRDQAKQKKQA